MYTTTPHPTEVDLLVGEAARGLEAKGCKPLAIFARPKDAVVFYDREPGVAPNLKSYQPYVVHYAFRTSEGLLLEAGYYTSTYADAQAEFVRRVSRA